jgi:MoaA/NifB/PqqE/SkfB family radical SAM enzyme
VDSQRIQNILAIEAGFVARDERAWGAPREAWIEVSARCNLRCVMCPITYDPRYRDGAMPEHLSPDRFSALEPLFAKLERAHLFGLGEPMLSPHLFEYARRLTAAGVEVWTTTNATLIGRAEAEAFADAGFSRVSVSIDGATAATYERIRRHGRFADVVAGIRALGEVRQRRGRPRLWLAMLAMASNVHDIPLLVDLAADAGADGVHLSSLYPWNHQAIEELQRTEALHVLGGARVEALLDEARRRARAHGIELSSHLDLAPAPSSAGGWPSPQTTGPRSQTREDVDTTTDLRWPCSEPWSTINVNARGEVRTCCFNDEVMGTLGNSTAAEIWNGPRYLDLRRQHLDLRAPPSCARCVGAGRVKRSPFLPSPPTAAAPAQRPLPAVLSPNDGDACDGRLVVIGTLPQPRLGQRLLRALETAPFPSPWRAWASRRVEPPMLPEVYVDGELVTRAADSGSWDGSRWAIVMKAPFVSPGSHRLTVRAPARVGGEPWAERRLQFVDLEGAPPIVATDTLTMCLELDRPEPPPLLSIAGRERRPTAWLCGTYADAWRGFAVLDVADLEPGTYSVDIALAHHARRRVWFERVAVGPPAGQP